MSFVDERDGIQWGGAHPDDQEQERLGEPTNITGVIQAIGVGSDAWSGANYLVTKAPMKVAGAMRGRRGVFLAHMGSIVAVAENASIYIGSSPTISATAGNQGSGFRLDPPDSAAGVVITHLNHIWLPTADEVWAVCSVDLSNQLCVAEFFDRVR